MFSEKQRHLYVNNLSEAENKEDTYLTLTVLYLLHSEKISQANGHQNNACYLNT